MPLQESLLTIGGKEMTNKEKNIINVLTALSNNAYELYEIYERDGEHDTALKYLNESDAYHTAVKIISNNANLKHYAKLYDVELINE